MASPMALSGQASSCGFLRLSPELRKMIYRLIFPTKATEVAENPSSLNLFYTNSEIYAEASSFFYAETTFPINISMNEIHLLGESFSNDKKPFIPNRKLYRRVQNLCIGIDWKYNPYIGRMGSCGSIEKAAVKMQKGIEGLCSALAPFIQLQTIEIVCNSKRTPPTGGGPDASIPRPSLTKDLLGPFKLLQSKKPTTGIWITDIENLTGRRLRRGELDRKSLKSTMVDLAHQLKRSSGPGAKICMRM